MAQNEVDFDFKSLLFYHYFPPSLPPPHPSLEKTFHEALATSLRLYGRIRVSPEGLNVVLTGPSSDLCRYLTLLNTRGKEMGWLLSDIEAKWGEMRPDLDASVQLFKTLKVQECSEVVSLVVPVAPLNPQKKRGRRKPKFKGTQAPPTPTEEERLPPPPPPTNPNPNPPTNTKLTPTEWHAALSSSLPPNSVLLDTRNVYESNIGRFELPENGNPNITVLTNTRQFSTIKSTFEALAPQLENKSVYMYCTGGVRCEVASKALIEMIPLVSSVTSLDGGICKYMDSYGRLAQPQQNQQKSLFRGKNFVFDPRRFDPNTSGDTDFDIVGRCVVCDCSHDDYDNGKSYHANNERRCHDCRVLVLVCTSCSKEMEMVGCAQGGGGCSVKLGQNLFEVI